MPRGRPMIEFEARRAVNRDGFFSHGHINYKCNGQPVDVEVKIRNNDVDSHRVLLILTEFTHPLSFQWLELGPKDEVLEHVEVPGRKGQFFIVVEPAEEEI